MRKVYFAQPLFDQNSPDFEHLRSLPDKFTLNTPGARLALALNYYTVEAYAREADRDAACGMTAHPDIMYVPTDEVSAEETDMIGCGYPIGHPDFERVLDPIFSRLVERLIGKMMAAGRNAKGPIAMEALSVARTRYTIEAIANRDSIRFEVDGLAVFEKRERATINATCAFLEERLHLHLLPTPTKLKAH
jgi:hypothetical protein